MKNISISPENAKALDVWEKWKKQGVVISDRLAKLMIKFDEVEEHLTLQLQKNDGGLTPNEAFLASTAVEQVVNLQTIAPIIEKEEQVKRKQLEREREQVIIIHNKEHMPTIGDLTFNREDINGVITFCAQHETTCYLCRERKERLQKIQRMHPGHKPEIDELKKRLRGNGYHPVMLDRYKSRYDECADCRKEYDECTKTLEENPDLQEESTRRILLEKEEQPGPQPAQPQ
jgi:hypothetical protein